MEVVKLNNSPLAVVSSDSWQDQPARVSTQKAFIEANTIATSLEEIKHIHTIPVFIKDNEPVISHHDFIDTTWQAVNDYFSGEQVLIPSIRLSHPVKGRIPEAKHKPAIELLEHEKTLYYERMAFVVEIPSIQFEIERNLLSLCVGGVKSYHLDNLNTKKGSDEHFKIFIGYQNKVCTNLCVWSDGYVGDVRVSSLGQLKGAVQTMLSNYNADFHLAEMRRLSKCFITESQFAHLLGRARIYQHLSIVEKENIPALLFGDNHIGTVCKDYYKDNSFCRDANGNINLWKLYNLFTGANKSSYIDSFLERGVNAYHFIEQIRLGLEGKASSWYLN
jgi:Domain of unknown function, B. Theta Gene description (DUF3871)